MKNLILFFVCFFIGVIVNAEPVDPSQRMMITLENGTKVEVMPVGDEYGRCWMSVEDGKCYVKEVGRNYYKEISFADFQEKSNHKRALARKNQRSASIKKENVTGQYRVPVILVEFSDKTFEDSHDALFYDEMLNQLGSQGQSEGLVGSVRDYFLAQSNNQLELSFDVIGPVRLSKEYSYYGEDVEGVIDPRLGEFAAEAISLAASQVDFSLYDWDDDGTVEQVMFIYAWYGQNVCDDSETIWPKKSQLDYRGGSRIRLNGVWLNVYACAPELRMTNADGAHQINGIGSFCHEFSHCLGLPDMYDGLGVNYGTSSWDLMGTGGHNNNGLTPAGYTSYDKMALGWQSPIILNEDVNIDNMMPMSEGGDFYMIQNDAYIDEYYLLENRQQIGWDEKLPGHGMLILHVDYDAVVFSQNKVNSSENDHELCSIVKPDNFCISGSNRDKQRDVYPWEGNDCLTNTSLPNAMLYHLNVDNTYLLSKPVYDIHENGDGTMGFQFVNEVSKSEEQMLSVSDGLLRYTSDTSVSLTVKVKNNSLINTYDRHIGAYLFVDGDLQESRDFVQKTILPNEEVEYVFNLADLEDGLDYKLQLFYYKENGTNMWFILGEPYMFRMEDRNMYTLMVIDDKLTLLSKSKASLEVTIHNESYYPFTYNLGAYVYCHNEIQEPRSFIIDPLIESYGDNHFQFILEGLEMYKEYNIYVYYYKTGDSNPWILIGGPYQLYIDENTETGVEYVYGHDASIDGQLIKVYSLDGRYVGQYENYERVLNLSSGIYILKPLKGGARKIKVQ